MSCWDRKKWRCIPGDDHLAVHILQLLLGHLQGVRRGVQLVSLEALIAEVNRERLIIGLWQPKSQ
jgi:hypothetical protein